MNLEVRCCCQPQKLLGWLPVPVNLEPRVGAVAHFKTAPARVYFPRQQTVSVQVALNVTLTIAEWRESCVVEPDAFPADVAGFELEVVSRLAYKAEDVPIEVLRQIPGFREAPAS